MNSAQKKKTPFKTRLLVKFKEVGKQDVALVGGKGANLGEMAQAGFPVPDGFILTSNAYYYYLDKNKLRGRIKQALSGFDRRQPTELFAASKAVKKIILAADFPDDLAKKVFVYYETLGGRLKNVYVAVRSSATAEDLPDASFAGQQETFLNVRGEASLISSIKEAYASLFTPRAIFYREEKGFDHFDIGIAIPVQKMIESEISGVMFTVDPVNNDKKQLVIEAIWGLGEYIVQGTVTPDQYLVEKQQMKIVHRSFSRQKVMLTLGQGKNIEKKVALSKQNKRKISDKTVLEIAKLGKKVQQHYFFPQDIEWALEKNKLFLLQTRPITTIKGVDKKLKIKDRQLNLKLLVKGDGASPGIVSGYAVFVKSPKDIGKVEKGDILVTSMTSPDFVPAMKRAAGIVTDRGGLTSHAAIVSRELGVPCVVGTKNGTKLIKPKTVVTINGSTGEVFSGGKIEAFVEDPIGTMPEETKDAKSTKNLFDLKTATKVYVNLADPDTAELIAKKNVDGVGLLRAEFIMAQMKKHPKQFIKEKKQKEYIGKLADSIAVFCRAFEERPVIYRSADFKTNEYAHLIGGSQYEPKEENPLIGWRGVRRYLDDEEVFEMELSAIKTVRQKMGLKNLWLMMPFVRTVQDLREVKKLVGANGLIRSPSFKFFMMCEIPSNVILLKDFIKVGIDGVSVGSNDLTMLTLGVDRDSERLGALYNETDPAVQASLEKIVKTCKKNMVLCSICGEAPSNHPAMVKKLVLWGITSISVSPDVIDKTRCLVFEAEKDLVSGKK